MLSVRPKVTDLVFQLYGRSLHPELFQIYQTRTIERGGYEARLQITAAGHVVTWRHAGLTLTELAVCAQHPLPQKRRLILHRIRGQRHDHLQCRGGVRYQVSFSMEVLEPEMFWHFHDELSQEGEERGLLHTFPSPNRITPGALSYLTVETRQKALLVQAFHTFPADCAVVKSQSVFELPK